MMIEYNAARDTLYVNINDSHASVSDTRAIDRRLEVDYAGDGSVIAVHFLQASQGIVLDAVPERDRVERELLGLSVVLQQWEASSKRPPRSGRTGT